MTQETFMNLPVRVFCLAVPVKWRREPASTAGYHTLSAEFVHGEAKPLDVWEQRNAFLRLTPSDNDALVKFLDQVGPFDRASIDDAAFDGSVSEYKRYAYRGRTYEVYKQPERDDRHFWELQIWLAELLTDEGWGKWKEILNANAAAVDVHILLESNPPSLVLSTTSFFEAVLLSIKLDRMQGMNFIKCARPDCGITFSAKPNQRRKYCQWYCGHIETVRRSRPVKKQAAEDHI